MNVRIESNGPSSGGTKVVAEGGAELKGLKSVDIHIGVGDITAVDLRLIGYTSVSVSGALAAFRIIHPVTGKLELVRRIEFEDGTVFPPEAAVCSAP